MSTPHSSGFARLASEAFYFAIPILSFYDFINIQRTGSYRLLLRMFLQGRNPSLHMQ